MPLTAQSQKRLELLSSSIFNSPPDIRDAMNRLAVPNPPPVKVQNFTIPGPAGNVPMRLYGNTESSETLPVVVFFHGGGFIAGSIDSHDYSIRELAIMTGYLFVSVDYRLAPEAKYPAGLEDCYAATVWVHANAASINADPSKIVLMGDSAGGNLVAATTLMSREKSTPPIAFQVLIYPCLAHPSTFDNYESYKTNGTGYFITRLGIEQVYDYYLPEPISKFADDPYVTPLKATNLEGLPPALILTAEYDPLRDEGEAYADYLKASGVPTLMSRYDGVIHSAAFFPSDERESWHKQIHDVLKNFFTKGTLLP